jgi:hypothetical protein
MLNLTNKTETAKTTDSANVLAIREDLQENLQELQSSRQQQHLRLTQEYDQTRYWPRIAALQVRCAANGHVLIQAAQACTLCGAPL